MKGFVSVIDKLASPLAIAGFAFNTRHDLRYLRKRKADDYVSGLFSHQHTVIDRIETPPEKPPELFITLTK